MKKALLTLSLLIVSTSSYAVDAKKQMQQQDAVVHSKQVAAVVAQYGGQIDAVDYKSTGDALIGPAYFIVRFQGLKDGAAALCALTAHVNTQSLQVMGVSSVVCK